MRELLATPTIRDTTGADLAEVVRLQAASWRAAYAGLMPPAYLDAMDTGPETIARAERRLAERPAGYHDLVAVRHGRIVAFVKCGPERPMPEQVRAGAARGEVYALYAHPDAWSTGAGALLLAAARDRMRVDGREQQVLWVLEGNARGRAFYERQGLRPTGEQMQLRLGGVVLNELQYGNAASGSVPTWVVLPQTRTGDSLTPSRRGV
jgi:GNAT superfamily N-acetyltransferase